MRHLSLIALALLLGAGFGYAQQNTTAADTPEPSKQSSAKKINPPRLLNQVNAIFPYEARQRRINGCCLILLTVDVKGMPQEIKLVRCSDPSFEKNSLSAIAKYRFNPATTKDGAPVSVKINVDIAYWMEGNTSPAMPVLYAFGSPPGITSAAPDADGVYPLTESCTPPIMTKFSDNGYGSAAFVSLKGNGACDIVLTMSTKGKATDPKVTRCDRPELEKPAIESLLKSQYTPGMVNGKAVPMRASVHLEYGGDAKP
jgi:TonB family protein